MIVPDKKYNLIYADPPWKYDDARTSKSAGMALSAYPCMTVEQLIDLPIKQLCQSGTMLAMWATFPKLPQALQVLDGWGFTYSTVLFTWVKLNPKHDSFTTYPVNHEDIYSGLGHYTRANCEVVLLGRYGNTQPLSRATRDLRQVFFYPRGRHSEKPAIVRTFLTTLFGKEISKIELFAREKVEGWDAWGNEV